MDINYLINKANSKLINVHPSIHSKAIKLVRKCHSEGIYILITHGFRSFAEQDALYAQGRTVAGKIVTNAKGGYSYHNFGLAFDFCVLDDPTKINWNVDSRWKRVGTIGESLGLEWGGRWTGFVDYPHFQLTFGLSLADLRAGKKPPVIVCNEEDEEMLKERFEPIEHSELTSGQLNMLNRLISIGAVSETYKPSLNTLETMSIIDSAFKNSGFYDFAKKK
ncbi:M15 family metallopeptidase [Bacillus sp. FJAT-49705]|uniref:M15 family metallopeptidase n=1 Tax=Cytobacillus citreus TaxID=2833586 RepID=A0ABS5NW69_9BACI|nr:M15 family metallopeptidase [Cytobacillus citreus]MBS4191179.1 M15 family metallopeptidase [Cytobacillus citreus]